MLCRSGAGGKLNLAFSFIGFVDCVGRRCEREYGKGRMIGPSLTCMRNANVAWPLS